VNLCWSVYPGFLFSLVICYAGRIHSEKYSLQLAYSPWLTRGQLVMRPEARHTCSRTEPLKMSSSGFLWARCSSIIQPTVSEHWRKVETLTLTTGLASSFFHPPLDWWGKEALDPSHWLSDAITQSEAETDKNIIKEKSHTSKNAMQFNSSTSIIRLHSCACFIAVSTRVSLGRYNKVGWTIWGGVSG